MLVPGRADFIFSVLDQLNSYPEGSSADTVVSNNLDFRLYPYLRFPSYPYYMHMDSFLLSREEEEPKTPCSENGRTHGWIKASSDTSSGLKDDHHPTWAEP